MIKFKPTLLRWSRRIEGKKTIERRQMTSALLYRHSPFTIITHTQSEEESELKTLHPNTIHCRQNYSSGIIGHDNNSPFSIEMNSNNTNSYRR